MYTWLALLKYDWLHTEIPMKREKQREVKHNWCSINTFLSTWQKNGLSSCLCRYTIVFHTKALLLSVSNLKFLFTLSCVIFLDFCKVFDTVSSRTLLGKMPSPQLDEHHVMGENMGRKGCSERADITLETCHWFCHPWPCALQHVRKLLGCRTRRDTRQVCQWHYIGRSFQAPWRKGGPAERPWKIREMDNHQPYEF